MSALTPPPADLTLLPDDQPPSSETTESAGTIDPTDLPSPSFADTIGAVPRSPIDSQTTLGVGAPPVRDDQGTYGPLSPGVTFGPRYDIIRLLGIGGMGAVYQAWDRELGVAVALKVIKPPADADAETARKLELRFKRELLLARQVTHKCVVRIHDLGEIAGIKYITMPFVDGNDLATVLRQESKLPPQRVLRIARQVIAGLAAAHEAGVIHRDLKPANIMIEGDQALIMDFGIAQSTAAGPKERHDRIVGTLAYMSPQQATGQPVDHRSDLYSFGLILYDLLGGRPLSRSADSSMADMLARIGNVPAPIRTINPDVPEALERIIARCLQPALDARYQSAAEIAADLDRLDDDGIPIPIPKVRRGPIVAVAAVLTVALSIGGWWIGRGGRQVVPVQHDPVSVLIADVQNASGDAAFDNTFEQALGIAIEKATFISVYPRKEARALAVKLAPASGGHVTSETSQLIAKSAGVKVVLAGSLERRGTAFHVAVNVIDPANNKVVRAVEDEARSREQVLPVLDKVADKVRSALGETATEAEALSKAETFTTSSLGAMQAYARGQELTALGNRPEALKAYAEAVAADPNFGRAYAGMGVVYYNLKQLDKSEEAYQKALKHLNVMTEREQLRTLGGYYISVPRNYDQAIITYEQLVAAYPADNVGYANLALAYFYKRNFQKAMAMGKKAVDIYPKNVLQRTNVAAYAMYAGDFKTAIAEAQTLLKDNPGYEYALLALSMSNLASGDRQAAVDAYARLEQTSTLGASMAASGGIDLALLEGRVQDALKLSPKGIAASQKANDTSNLAQKYILAAEASLAAGLKTQAAAYAQQAVATRKHEAVLFPAALVLIQTGHEDAAQEIAATLDNMLQTQTAAYARLIDGATALAHRRFGNAIEAFRDSQKRSDSWFSHFLLGRAYMEAGSSHAAEALSELMACVKRHGEATDAFLADTPTLRYLPPVYYWLARAQETVGSTADAKSSYEEFLKWRSAADASDQLAADAKKRLEQ